MQSNFCAVLSRSIFPVSRIIRYCRIYQWTVKALIRLDVQVFSVSIWWKGPFCTLNLCIICSLPSRKTLWRKNSAHDYGTSITKTCLYNFDLLKPHFYIVKLGFTGVYIIFLISAQNIDCGYSLELPHWGGSNEYPQSMFWANEAVLTSTQNLCFEQKHKKCQNFLSENFHFLVINFAVCLNSMFS